MITVYHIPGSRSSRVVWVLEEMGLAYEALNVRTNPEAAERYKAANPTGALPAIEDGGTVMFESMAICEYLAQRYGPTPLVVQPDEPDYPTYLQYLHYGEATLAGMAQGVVMNTRFLPEEMRSPKWAALSGDRMIQRLAPVEASLSGKDFLAGGRLTLADISVGYAVSMANFAGLGDRLTPELTGYWERLIARPAAAKAFAH